jgi:hypothetical protein
MEELKNEIMSQHFFPQYVGKQLSCKPIKDLEA